MDYNEIPVGKDPQEPEETLTDAQIYQTDKLHNAVYNAVCEVVENFLPEKPAWNIEWIGDVSDAIVDVCERYFNLPEKLIYPYLDEE